MSLTRYEIEAENSYDYEGDIVGTYVDCYEDPNGDWVKWEDVQTLIKENKRLQDIATEYSWVRNPDRMGG